MGAETTFAADEHLGRLARWLRLAGRDVIHRNPFADSELIRLASQDGRVVLTMDSRVVRLLPKGACLRIRSYDVEEQFLEVFRIWRGDPLEKAFSRCAVCNETFRVATADEIEARVPPRARRLGGEFRACPGCGKVFWEGTHYRRVKARLESLRRQLGPAGRPGGTTSSPRAGDSRPSP